MQPDIIDWHYNKVHHGKGVMDRIGVMVKNLVYHRVLSGDVVVNTLREFVEWANQISSVDYLFLDKSEFIQEPEEISKSTPILSTLNFYKVSRVLNGPHSLDNYYFKLSEDLEPFHVQIYGIICGHSVNNINNETLCNSCYKRFIFEEE